MGQLLLNLLYNIHMQCSVTPTPYSSVYNWLSLPVNTMTENLISMARKHIENNHPGNVQVFCHYYSLHVRNLKSTLELFQ